MSNKLYSLAPITSKIWQASCKECGKSFRSDVKSKAKQRVIDHLRDAHGKEVT